MKAPTVSVFHRHPLSHSCGQVLAGLVVALAITLSFSGTATAQTGVMSYRMEFIRTGRSVNYPRPQDGYLIVDLASGSVSSVVLLDDPVNGGKYYTAGLLSGSYFQVTAESNGRVSDVISTSSGGRAESTMLQVNGRANSDLDIGGGENVSAARQMTGFILMNGADAIVVDSEADNPDSSTDVALGFVGSSRVSARFAESDTQNFNNNGKSASEAVTSYSEWYENKGIPSESGFTPPPDPNPFPTPDINPSPSPTPLPTPEPNPFGF